MPRVVLITGCSRGFGHSLAQTFINAGDFVVATARDPTTLSFTNITPENHLLLKLDVTSNGDIDAAFTSALKKFGRIDIVINNAAFGLMGPLETLTDEQIRHQFDVNFFPIATITRKAVATMRTQNPPGGKILQISSLAGEMGFPMMSAYCGTKFAVEALTEAVRQEVKPEWGIQLCVLVPGLMNTEAHTKSMVYGDVDVPAYEHMDARKWVEGLDKTSRTEGLDTMIVAEKVCELTKRQDLPGKVVIGSAVLEIIKGLKREMDVVEGQNVVDI